MSNGETLYLSVPGCAVVECFHVWVEVWNENAPMPDTLISSACVKLANLVRSLDAHVPLEVELFRNKPAKSRNSSTKAGSQQTQLPQEATPSKVSYSHDAPRDSAPSVETLPGGTLKLMAFCELDRGLENADSELVICASDLSVFELPETEVGGFLVGAKQDPYLKLHLGEICTQVRLVTPKFTFMFRTSGGKSYWPVYIVTHPLIHTKQTDPACGRSRSRGSVA